jgi:hypothetical protein
MRSKIPVPARTTAVAVSVTALLSAAALIGALAPEASAAPTAAALPLPIPAAGVEPLVTEGVTVEGPLINTIALPSLK